MIETQPRRLADGGIDYDHYRRRARKLRSGARRNVVRRCWRLTHRLIGAALVAAAFVQIAPGSADCVICGAKPLDLVITSHP